MVTREHFVNIARQYLVDFEHTVHTGNDQRTEAWIQLLADLLEGAYSRGYVVGYEQANAAIKDVNDQMRDLWQDVVNGVCVYCHRRDCQSDHK